MLKDQYEKEIYSIKENHQKETQGLTETFEAMICMYFLILHLTIFLNVVAVNYIFLHHLSKS